MEPSRIKVTYGVMVSLCGRCIRLENFLMVKWQVLRYVFQLSFGRPARVIVVERV